MIHERTPITIPTCSCGYSCKTFAGLSTHIKNADDPAIPSRFREGEGETMKKFVVSFLWVIAWVAVMWFMESVIGVTSHSVYATVGAVLGIILTGLQSPQTALRAARRVAKELGLEVER